MRDFFKRVTEQQAPAASDDKREVRPSPEWAENGADAKADSSEKKEKAAASPVKKDAQGIKTKPVCGKNMPLKPLETHRLSDAPAYGKTKSDEKDGSKRFFAKAQETGARPKTEAAKANGSTPEKAQSESASGQNRGAADENSAAKAKNDKKRPENAPQKETVKAAASLQAQTAAVQSHAAGKSHDADKSQNAAGKSQYHPKNGGRLPASGIKPQDYLDTILTSRTEKKRAVKQLRKQRRRRNLLAFLATLVMLCAIVYCAQSKDVLDLDLPFVSSTAFAATPQAITLDEYESEYAQFGLELENGVILVLPDGEAEAEMTPGPASTEEGQDAPGEIIATIAAEGEGPLVDELEDEPEEKTGTPVIFLNGVPVCSLESAEDALWVRKALLDKYTVPVAGGKPTKRGFADEFSIKYTVEPQTEFVSRDEAYLMLLEKVHVRLREDIEVIRAVKYKTVKVNEPSLEAGKTQVQQEGLDGQSMQLCEVVSINGEETERTEKGEAKITLAPQDKIVLVGTKITSTPTPRPKQSDNSSGVYIPEEGGVAAYTGSKTTYGCEKPGSYSTAAMPDKSYAFPGSEVGSGKYYPNIDTDSSRPSSNEGIAGPSPGSLNFGYAAKGYGRKDINSYFGWRYGRMHYGNDTFAPEGTAIIASESGTVTSYTGTHTGYGETVEINHGNGFTTRYAHCATILVKNGQYVKKGEQIATIGASGTSDGKTHLHFEIRHNGVPYNPLFYM